MNVITNPMNEIIEILHKIVKLLKSYQEIDISAIEIFVMFGKSLLNIL